MSIHHLENDGKEKLYKNIHSKLNNNGCFINLDQFIVKSERINALYNSQWYDYIDSSGIKQEEKAAWLERRKLDKENTIDETIKLLEKSGFASVECIYSFMKFSVIIAVK
jgi:tRNA (cmo5U34)-methyltransferase